MGAGVSRRERSLVTIWILISDLHFPKIHWDTWRCFLAWLRYLRESTNAPIAVLINGDFLDFPTISRFGSPGDRDPNILPDLKVFVRECNAVRALCDRVVVNEGNHEERYWQKLVGSAPREFHGLIGLTLHEQLRFQGLDESVEWRRDDAKGERFKIGHVRIRHGHTFYKKGGPAHVGAHLVTKRHRSYAVGHVHRQQLYVVGIPGERTEYGVANPTMEEQPDWGPDEQWSRGWTYFEVDEERGYAYPHPVLCEDGRTAWGGRLFDGRDGAGSVGAARAGRGRQRRDYVHHDGRSLSQLADATGIPYRTLVHRVSKGWHGDALLEPVDAARSARRRAQLAAQKQTPPA